MAFVASENSIQSVLLLKQGYGNPDSGGSVDISWDVYVDDVYGEGVSENNNGGQEKEAHPPMHPFEWFSIVFGVLAIGVSVAILRRCRLRKKHNRLVNERSTALDHPVNRIELEYVSTAVNALAPPTATHHNEAPPPYSTLPTQSRPATTASAGDASLSS
ncbi:MAG: hypothetical protein J3R72DRAFT_150388 [Linnemannia gamsii]|nr:MAG: hypothetical protein J3R72DRAFT_150388 [Linnemannia gamsii]